jgi:choline kinase
MYNITVAILAAGIPKKMKSYGPTSLIKVDDDRILLDDQINKIRYIYKNANIVIVAGYEFQKIKRKLKSPKVELIENLHFDSTNSAHSLLLATKNNPVDNLLMIHGDILFNVDTLKYISNIHYSENSAILYDQNNMIKPNKPGILKNQYVLEHINYLHKNKWAQIAFFNKGEYNKLLKVNPGNRYSFELINEINSNENSVFYCHSPNNMKLIEIECTKDLTSEKFKSINS